MTTIGTFSNFGFQAVDSNGKVVKTFVSSTKFFNPTKVSANMATKYPTCKLKYMNSAAVTSFLSK